MLYFKSLPIKIKWTALLASLVLLLILAYWFNVRKTILLYCSYKKLELAINNLDNEDVLMQQYEPGPRRGDKDSLKYTTSSSALKEISALCNEHSVEVKQIAQTIFRSTDTSSYTIETNKIILEGSYSATLTLLYDIEKVRKIASISSVKFELTKDIYEGNYRLLSTLYIKYIIYGKEY